MIHAASVKAWEAESNTLRDEILRLQAALKNERGRCAHIADDWAKPDVLRLHAGEMTTQELRTAQVVARGIAAMIRRG